MFAKSMTECMPIVENSTNVVFATESIEYLKSKVNPILPVLSKFNTKDTMRALPSEQDLTALLRFLVRNDEEFDTHLNDLQYA